jgi:alpha-glucosidase
MPNRSTALLISVLLLSSGACSRPQQGTVREVVRSPDGEIEVVFRLDPQGAPRYRVLHKDAVVIDTSRLGFDLRESGRLDRAFEIAGVSRSTFNETWEQPWGESRLVTNHFNELAVDLRERSEPGRRLRVIFRAFDDGIGFRYEYLYRNTPLTEFEAAHTPLTLETSTGLTLTLHEANLTDYASMTLRPTRDNTLECDLVPWSDGTKVRASTPHRTPWRTLQIAEQPEELLESRQYHPGQAVGSLRRDPQSAAHGLRPDRKLC